MPRSKPSTLVERLDALYEYDREPVKENQLHGWRTFIAMFSSEHIAGTEFILGPLLVAHGVTVFDAFVGLALGNLLAVLSWTFVCAPIAVKERLTVYWLIRKLAGPYLTILYCGLFAVVLCLLAGAMVNVSTTAVALTLGVESPNFLKQEYVPSVPWIAIAVVVGTVVASFAVLGFKQLAHFAKVAAPWMPCLFLAGGLASLASLGVTSLEDFWKVADEKIWTGVAEPGQIKYGFWHCVGLAWLCNITQHLGMGDATIFRYAKNWRIGFSSGFGMFLGHYMAWICSGIMCAAFKHAELAAGVDKPNINPGNIAMFAAGWAGLVCVVLAGWTTANPTLYRAGLAFQVATPNWRRWVVTLVAGVLMIIAACIPAVNYFLDMIVAYYGLFFMPLGAFIFIDFWVLPRLGMTPYFAERHKLLWSWPAAVGWFGSFGVCFLLYAKDHYSWFAGLNGVLPKFLADYEADFFLQVLPAWILAVSLYLVCSVVQQKLFPPQSSQETSS